MTGHMNWVRTCQFSPECRLAASGGDDRSVRIWDLQSKRCLRVFEDHQGTINYLKIVVQIQQLNVLQSIYNLLIHLELSMVSGVLLYSNIGITYPFNWDIARILL